MLEYYKDSEIDVYKRQVKYTFGALNKDITGYSVKVIPNAAGKDFNFTVDGQMHSFQAETDLTAGFEIERGENSFTIAPKGGINKILAATYPCLLYTSDTRHFVAAMPAYQFIG